MDVNKVRSPLVSSWPHKWFGLFARNQDSEEFRYLPSIQEFTDVHWQPSDLPSIIEYLRMAPLLMCCGQTPVCCPLCMKTLPGDGSAVLTDGVWTWHYSLHHFVEEHNVVLPTKMVEHIRNSNYMVAAGKHPKVKGLQFVDPDFDLSPYRK